MDFGLWFLTGLLTSAHCVAMCGTMVASIAIKDASGARKLNLPAHLAYNGAKLVSYTAVGALLGLLGSVVDFGPLRGGVSILAGIFMVVMGLNILNVFPWLRYCQIRFPKSLGRFIVKKRSGAAESDSILSAPLTFGSLSGLMPCGPLQAMQLYAAGSGSAATGAAAMFTFGLGTMPAMIVFGTLASAIGHALQKKVMKVAAVAIIGLGLIMLNRGLVLQGIPYNLNTAWIALKAQFGISEKSKTASSKGDSGVQKVEIAIVSSRFVPSSISLKPGVPVRLVIDRRENDVCSDELVVPQLGIRKKLAPFAKTVVEFAPKGEGAINLTCQMGMMQATAFVGDQAAVRSAAGPKPFFSFLAGAVLAWIAVSLGWMPGFASRVRAKAFIARKTGPDVGRSERPTSPHAESHPEEAILLRLSYDSIAAAFVIFAAFFSGAYLGSAAIGTNYTAAQSAGAPLTAGPPPFSAVPIFAAIAGFASACAILKLKEIPGFINLQKGSAKTNEVDGIGIGDKPTVRITIPRRSAAVIAVAIISLFALYLATLTASGSI